MGCTVVVGTQWGDEGKGKIVDYLTPSVDIVARYQGGANAGHTVVVGGRTFILHQIPSGILNPGVVCVIGNGVVLDPLTFFEEISGLKEKGVETGGRIKISERTHLILPFHKELDCAREGNLGDNKIGTTCRGIGPAYEDKAGRIGIRMVDLMDPDLLSRRIQDNVRIKNVLLRHLGSRKTIDAGGIADEVMGYRAELLNYMDNTSLFLTESMEEGKTVLAEGAQGVMLDVDHGTYPFVTSSNMMVGGVSVGLGISTLWIDRIIGVAKAYTTRVGMGPMPTELEAELGERLRSAGKEHGATTGRPRRCGWFDAPVVRYSVRLNGITELALTKLDVLDGLPFVKLCSEYLHDGETLYEYPAVPGKAEKLEPVYIEMKGWERGTGGVVEKNDLSPEAVAYLERIEELVACPVRYISTGQGREEIIDLKGFRSVV